MTPAELKGILKQEGFVSVKSTAGLPIWVSGNQQVEGFFSPHVRKVGGRFLIVGVIGLHISEFEAWWLNRLKTLERMPHQGFLFSKYLTAEADFFDPPEFGSDSNPNDLRNWISMIFQNVAGLGATLPEFLCDIEVRGSTSRALGQFVPSPKKLTDFLAWLEERFPEQAIPTLLYETAAETGFVAERDQLLRAHDR